MASWVARVRAGDADEIFVDAGVDQPFAIGGVGQMDAVGLDAYMREAGGAGAARQVRQVAPQRDLRAGEDQAFPAPVRRVVLRASPRTARPISGVEPMHRALDHAMHAVEVAAKLHRQRDVVRGCRKRERPSSGVLKQAIERALDDFTRRHPRPHSRSRHRIADGRDRRDARYANRRDRPESRSLAQEAEEGSDRHARKIDAVAALLVGDDDHLRAQLAPAAAPSEAGTACRS